MLSVISLEILGTYIVSGTSIVVPLYVSVTVTVTCAVLSSAVGRVTCAAPVTLPTLR